LPALSLMFKTVSACNLDCAYCYDRESSRGADRRTLDIGLLEKVIPEAMAYAADAGGASFSWQGGEPTLAGLGFFRKAVALEVRHAAPGTIVDNSLQTNAVLIDDEWARFLAEHRFLVGVSLDGPERIHDAARRDRGGRGSFARAMAGLDALRRRGVEVNALTVIGPHNGAEADALWGFYTAEGLTHVQLLPAMAFQASEPFAPVRYGVDAAAYGALLVSLFDRWYADGAPLVSIRTFDNLAQSYAGLAAELCVHADRCDSGLVVTADGTAYPCDFYLHEEFRLGDLARDPLAAVAECAARRAFADRKRPLPTECARCVWLPRCRGGCPRNRASGAGAEAEAEAGSDIFCASYGRLLEHAGPRLEALADRMRRRASTLAALDRLREEGRAAPGRNDPCPCGSWHKLKKCCGEAALERSYAFRRTPAPPR
jgi:uncharacterized protein